MKIWIARHGQTRYNKMHLMQGRTDEPLNETGIEQAKAARAKIGDIRFDAVYASPLNRAIVTGSIIGNVDRSGIIIDDRLIEADFGKYELKNYYLLGPAMMLYWYIPELFPAPESVEKLSEMIERSHSFLKDLEKKDYENVLVACHGGIMRPLSGYLMDRSNGIYWRPKPKNCEIRVFESVNGKHRILDDIHIQ
ncbi:histidine phosphatase family protein [Oribacterium sp. WCC10]|uniref:histidine phosphatase family protein n=1 Tax=Oribacterium sp. WCC10 TaxID=1855343 RepID=UPI0008F07B29|nr:histidine phosphatase family protein [Oribacterium sp. WCC10]SFG62067.1 alpha-ribazole phosphatase/probable phosphoglycerate mutase [Oribacterium sp. WCC10]